MLKTILTFALLSASAFGQESSGVGPVADVKPVIQGPSVTALIAENESLKAQLAQLRIEIRYELQVCQMPDLMQARLAVQEAEAKKKEPAK